MGKCVENKAKMKILTKRFCNRPNNSLMLEFLLNRSFSFFLIWTVQVVILAVSLGTATLTVDRRELGG